MVILETCYKGATRADSKGRRYRAKVTCTIRRAPFRESYFVEGMNVSRNTCLETIRDKK